MPNNCQLSIVNCQLSFRLPAGTSRGTYTIRQIWYVVIRSLDEPQRWGIGECAPLPGLSVDDVSDYEEQLTMACRRLEQDGVIDTEKLRPYPSILFGLETAVQHYKAGNFILWDTPFAQGKTGIPINGLIWMGDYENMLTQVKEKMAAGYRCIKLKIGAIDFDKELDLLRHIRKHYSSREIELRVDANGAFSPADARDKLNRLAELDIHSIEQPIRAGQWEEMARLTASTPLPIALDEELIGHYTPEKKRELLQTIRPQYIILKPSLHGGISGCTEWINEARRLHIDWWITSALESNIGLNAIAQWCATWNNPLPQGLGTGQLFTDNVDLPLHIRQDSLWFDPHTSQSAAKENTFLSFIPEWFNDSPFIEVQTSGSTGNPKRLNVRKEQMMASARMTCEYLGLRPGDKALLCMPMQYIAGIMMVIRTWNSGLNLLVRTPSAHPLAEINESLRFAAMTPMQVHNSLKEPVERKRLQQIDILLIGGGAIDKELEKELSIFPNAVYSSYGMTETLSHIALRRLNGPDISPYYIPLPSVDLSLSEENTLIIHAPMVSDEVLYTHDIAEILPDGRFRILGRTDNVINSGGIKIVTEELEELLRSIISVNFAITSVPSSEFGEAVVLLIETKNTYSSWDGEKAIKSLLPRYHHPRYIREVDKIPLTGNGKIDRTACKRLAVNLIVTL